uniref:MENTAL domain-containing protein n=1 Tax=Capra hircus TaxID=9925 RepID=A0A8C2NS32_CAPHI
MNPLPEDMENTLTGSQSSHASVRDVHSINPTQLMARIESYEGREKKGISDVRRTFCLFVTFDLLFVTLLWIIELNVNGGIENTLEKEVVQYDYYSSYFDIFLLAVFRFKVLILAYAVCRLRHWWAIAVSMPGEWFPPPVLVAKVYGGSSSDWKTWAGLNCVEPWSVWAWHRLVQLGMELCTVLRGHPPCALSAWTISSEHPQNPGLLSNHPLNPRLTFHG